MLNYYFVSARFLYRVDVSFSFSWINFFFWGSLWTVYAVQAENSENHCYWSLFTVLLVLLDMTISWVQQMWIQLPYFCCSLAFSVPLSSHKWSIKFKCKTILTVYLHNVSLHCWSLCCFLLTWCKAVSQGSRERDAKAKPTPFSGHLLLHCTAHLHSLVAVMLKAWWMAPCPSIPAIKCLSKINQTQKKGAHHFARSFGMPSARTCKMSQGWSQTCFSFATISSFICDSCQSLLTLNPQEWVSMLSQSLIIHGIHSYSQTLPCCQANTLTPRPDLYSFAETSCTHAESCLLLLCSPNRWAKKNPGVRSLRAKNGSFTAGE